ncbi:MAG: Do family serine endopeptidase, partial [Planctomycetota bacterium]
LSCSPTNAASRNAASGTVPKNRPARRPRRGRTGTAHLKLLGAITAASAIGVIAGTGWVEARMESTTPLERMPADVQQAVKSANNLSTAFRAVSNAVLPAVVSIENRPDMAMVTPANASPVQPGIIPSGDIIPAQEGRVPRNPLAGTPFEDFFNDSFDMRPIPGGPNFDRRRFFEMIPEGNRRMQPRRSAGIGSGVIIDDSGIILTNNHVVAGGGTVIVRTSDGREFTATEVLTDPSTDIAVVKIEDADNLTAARLGDSDSIDIGDWVLALGQPFGLESSVTAGIISAKQRSMGITERENFLQTDAAINPGNSGGPLVSLNGEVIGINTAIKSGGGGGNDGVGFAVPSNMARWVAEQLIETGQVRRAYLGVSIQPVDAELADSLGIPPRSGVVVSDVIDGTPAADTGLQAGDVIVAFNGTPINAVSQLQSVVERSKFGTQVPIEINRDGSRMTLQYTPTERPKSFGQSSSRSMTPQRPSVDIGPWGLEVAALDEDTAKALDIDDAEGVVITEVKSGSPAAAKGLQPGAVIVQVNRKPVRSVEDFKAIAEASDDDLLLLVKRPTGSGFVVLKR